MGVQEASFRCQMFIHTTLSDSVAAQSALNHDLRHCSLPCSNNHIIIIFVPFPTAVVYRSTSFPIERASCTVPTYHPSSVSQMALSLIGRMYAYLLLGWIGTAAGKAR